VLRAQTKQSQILNDSAQTHLAVLYLHSQMMSMMISNNEIVYKAFSYTRSDDTFLSDAQINYALKVLWSLTAGKADWTSDVVIRFKAITTTKVDEILDAKTDKINHVKIVNLTPDGFIHNLDSDSMPSLCLSEDCDRIVYQGLGFYPFDLVALAFILLTRWEEWARPVMDQFQRYKETASLAIKHGFHQRPILDEWALLLRSWLRQYAPTWSPVLPHPSISVSHDIDHLCYYKSWPRVFRGFSRGLVRQHSLISAYRNAYSGFISRLDHYKDPCVTAIDELMQFNHSLGLNGTFFLMSANQSKYDDGYDIASSLLRNKIDLLINSGHKIAWHTGYYAAYDDALYKQEFHRFNKVCGNKTFGARHHFLRWRAAESWQRMEQFGITFDASLGYTKTCGFRCSTAHAFPAYSLLDDKELNLEVRPLILMDGYLLNNPSDAQLIVERMLTRCHQVSGCFSLLIHNYTIMTHPSFLNSIYCSLKYRVNHELKVN